MTRKLATIALAVVALALTALAQAPAAGSAAPTKIGIINIQQAIIGSNEGQRDFQTLEKKFEPTRSELQNGNAEVENLKKQLSAQEGKLNEQARADLVKNIEIKSKALQRKLEDAQAEWQAQQTEITNRIGQKMLEVVQKYATDNGYSVILDVSAETSPVLWANATTNVTKPIVDAYNTQSGVPAPPAAPAAPAAKPAAAPAAPKK
jgi:outer membrane protein